MNHETLEQQTAPESTRGLFDGPEVPLSKRSTFHSLAGRVNEVGKNQRPVTMAPPRMQHQRSRSAVISDKNRRSFGLHTLAEESSMTVDSIQDMIKTLKTLPPLISSPNGENNNNHARKSLQPRNSTSSKLLVERRTSDDNMYLSREAALAEAEAKLMGTFNRRTSTDEDNHHFIKKRHSYQQMPVLTENTQVDAKRRSMNTKALSLSLDKKVNRRSSRNFDEWRNSTFSGTPTSSVSSNRSSFNLVPFTPTRVNFSRDDANPHQRRPLFIAHLPFSALTPLFRARQLVRGILRVNKRNRSDAYVACDDLDGDIYVCGSRDRNRALEGDVVAIRLVNVEKVLREKQEKEEAKLARNNGQVKTRLPDEEDENEIIFGGDEEIDAVKPKYAGVVVAILERAQNQVFSGTLTLSRPNNKRAQLEDGDAKKEAPRIVWFKATDKRVPLIAIPIEQVPDDFVDNNESYANRLFVGSIKRWPITSLHPFGTLERELGPITDLSVQIKAILADNNVTDTDFSEAVMQCIPPSPFRFTLPEDGSRRDMSDHRMLTIDANHNDLLEDGLSVVRLGDDTFEVAVHVCDPSYFIKPHSALDKEARARAVSVSLDQKMVPMLPSELINVAQFTVGELRPAFSVVWKLSSDGLLLDTWFGKTVVRSTAQYKYQEVQDIINKGNGETEVEKDLFMLYNVACHLFHRRYHKEAMSLERQYLEFDEPSNPESITINFKPSIRKIVKEFLFMANTCVAQKISSQYPDQALLRRQAPPNQRKIRELQVYALNYLNVELDITNASTLQHSIEMIEDPELRQLAAVLVLKTIDAPKYFCTGTFDIMKYAHFASGVPLFTHFTAPLRRYADVIVHRQLEATLQNEKHFYLDRDTVQKLAQHCNVKKEASLAAREQGKLLSLALYLVNKDNQQNSSENGITTIYHEARVISVMDNYFDVSLPEFGVERRIHLANLPIWRQSYDAHTRALTMYWKQGVNPSTGQQQPWSLSDDEYEEEELLSQYPENTFSTSSKHTTASSDESEPPVTKRASKRASIISARLSTSTAYSSEQCSQTIKALDKVRVMITIEMIRTPPLIRIFAANPYA